jgi:surfactin synthase thioesterase subunit
MTAPDKPDKWVRRVKPDAGARLRLFCLPFAGGGTLAFRGWEREVPKGVEIALVCPPGREYRIGEPAFQDALSLVDAAAASVRQHLDRPYAIFGHSMGALLGYELTRRLRDLDAPAPAHLFVSGHRAPHLPDRGPAFADLPDDAFLAELRRYNGTPEGVLASRELMDLMLPLMRADFRVCETYVHRPGPPLACPISVYGGLGDPDVTREELDAWSQHTTGACIVRMFPGDHFYAQKDPARFFAVFARELEGVAP